VVEVESVEWNLRGGNVDAVVDFTLSPTEGRVYWNGGEIMKVEDDVIILAVTYKAGFPPLVEDPLEQGGAPVIQRTDAPEEVRLAVLQTVQHYYESREIAKADDIPAIARRGLSGWWRSATAS
jgi:hypothetical protein